ncbi:hypothetical protein PF010_g25972 [Phytophthora fragariae]|uniref:Uncharacterized protein n=1 Tax=Phytophthora fragariae TaxID=53985 RepID=A0A6A3PI09_9STRA|nr:hypothetical protein PF003_g2772 [Phytophthora fragariae]KAE9054706.1 hypothetical protein PF006_g33189 [Phytophthora fragariae]KAE9071186.1 hypothetical protein PF010_g25972 [Phytophthora fragariae]KAE9256531.1 hypothetical protein PF001_g33373 [Phytophthora fragariae]
MTPETQRECFFGGMLSISSNFARGSYITTAVLLTALSKIILEVLSSIKTFMDWVLGKTGLYLVIVS